MMTDSQTNLTLSGTWSPKRTQKRGKMSLKYNLKKECQPACWNMKIRSHSSHKRILEVIYSQKLVFVLNNRRIKVKNKKLKIIWWKINNLITWLLKNICCLLETMMFYPSMTGFPKHSHDLKRKKCSILALIICSLWSEAFNPVRSAYFSDIIY